ncbi:MAG: PorT family protein [Spirochaetaceae bacterium]|nr:MAG: PorT family protein [Spirochaetaceae bacterium]
MMKLQNHRTAAMVIAFGVTVVLTTLAVPSAHAQEVRLGVKAALNLSWFSGSDWDDALDWLATDPDVSSVSNDANIGFIGGLFVDIPLGPGLSVQPELLLGRIGGAYSYRAFGVSIDGSVKATALKLPLLLKPKAAVGRQGALYGLIGPTPAFLLGDVDYQEKGDGFSVSVSDAPDNRFVFSATFGAGYEHSVGPGAINVEVRYNRTFTDIFDNDNTRINSVNIFGGYGFDL